MAKRNIAKSLLIVFIILCLVFAISWVKFLYTPLIQDQEGYKYTVKPGDSLKLVMNELQAQGVVRHPLYMQLLIRYRGDTPKLKAGEYLFPKGTTPSSMLQQMVTATGLVYHAFTIIPGWNFNDVRHALSEESTLQHSLQQMTDQEVMIQLGQPGVLPEGQFFPDTYYFIRNDTDMSVLRRAYHSMQTHLMKAWNQRAADLPYKTAYEALIAASLIEKEAYLDAERPKIASVLVNRLNKDMPLQFDPTIIFGLGDQYDGAITKKDLVTDTPYNTYVHRGLPPTPIGIPSAASINAALHPEVTDYYYFVAKGNGEHQFSKTLDEHEVAVEKAMTAQGGYFNDALIRLRLLTILEKKNG